MKKLALAATVALSITALGAGPAAAAGLGNTPDRNGGADKASASDKDDLAVRYATMTPYEVSHGKGIEYTVDGLEAGDVVTTSLNDEKSVVEKDGPFDGAVVVDEVPKLGVSFTVSVERDGERVKEMTARVDLIEGDRGEYKDGTLLVSPEPETNDTVLSGPGVNLTMVNCEADDEIRFRVFKKNADGQTKVWEKSQLAGEDEAASVRYLADSDKDLWGKYVITAECGDLEDSMPLTVYIDN
ncbi:hypothetical protein [Brevibacterium zhoupengii]|uniref:hypothetical protein n=1 Tax=Brevibacterium zhoupengii TaxID=2898795 RepID=UPI001F09B365|nr:hypothetical protein [Brevibacterium zhoupengii]